MMRAGAASPLLRPYAVPGHAAPLELARGEGCRVHGTDGREYLDAASGLWNLALGLNERTLLERMTAQAGTLGYATLFEQTNGVSERLARRLVALSNGAMQYAYLSTTGSSAVEAALRVARVHFRALGRPEKRRVVSFDLGYHGGSAMSLSASGLVHSDMAGWEDVLPDFVTAPSFMDEHASIAALERILLHEADSICCLLMEPVMGSAGVIVPSRGYCEAVSALCDAAGVLLVADEVATGGGRCGEMFASNALGLRPDIVALAKGLSAGYFPVGATLFAERVIEPLRACNAQLLFGSTQDGNPAGCAAALAALDIVAERSLCSRAATLGADLRERLTPLIGSTVVRDVRGLGLMIGLDLVHLAPGAGPFDEAAAAEARRLCRDEGLLVYHFASGLSLFPALTMTDTEADDVIDILTDVLERLV